MNNCETPTKELSSPARTFSPISVRGSPASSQKNLTGPPRVAKDIIADVYNAIQYWNDHHVNGAKIVKEIASLKKSNKEQYSHELEQLTQCLYEETESLQTFINLLEIAVSQINALQKLKPTDLLFISHTTGHISKLISEICSDYKREFKVKQLVLESIAHSRNIDECMFYAALWTHQPYISDSTGFKLQTLLIESGHKKI